MPSPRVLHWCVAAAGGVGEKTRELEVSGARIRMHAIPATYGVVGLVLSIRWGWGLEGHRPKKSQTVAICCWILSSLNVVSNTSVQEHKEAVDESNEQRIT